MVGVYHTYLREMKEYAKRENIPIMQDEGIDYLTTFIISHQIKEVLGLHTRYLDSIVLLNDKVTLTNFNPLLHTLLLGLPFKWGVEIGNVNLGLFFYIFMQVVIVIATLSYTIYNGSYFLYN